MLYAKKSYRQYSVDADLPDTVLDALNAHPTYKLTSICSGHNEIPATFSLVSCIPYNKVYYKALRRLGLRVDIYMRKLPKGASVCAVPPVPSTIEYILVAQFPSLHNDLALWDKVTQLQLILLPNL